MRCRPYMLGDYGKLSTLDLMLKIYRLTIFDDCNLTGLTSTRGNDWQIASR